MMLSLLTPPAARVSERTLLAPFTAAFDDLAVRDQRDLMERPFFSLAKSRRTVPILYRTLDVELQVHAVPDYGMATIWDADVLIWAASQLVEAADLGHPTSRYLRFVPYQLLRAIGRDTGKRQYELLRRALQRLQSTVIATTIRNGPTWRSAQFSWINEWAERRLPDGRSVGMEMVVPEWFYRGCLDRSLVLTIDPAYFALTGGVERWLYRVARKHAGHQPAGWQASVPLLHEKSGSLARLKDFTQDLLRVVRRQSLPGYRLRWSQGGFVLWITPASSPDLFTEPVDRPVNRLGTSGAASLGTSGTRLSVHQAPESQLNLWRETPIRPLNLRLTEESNLMRREAPPQRRRPSAPPSEELP